MSKLRQLLKRITRSLTDEKKRVKRQFIWVYSILVAVSFWMTLINLLTAKTALMCATLAFGLLCVLNIVLTTRSKKGMDIASTIFSVEIIALFLFFIISGTPEGFSAIWVCLLPSCGMLLFGRKKATVMCFVMFILLLFFFQIPLGQGLLQYQYTNSFMLRFPMLYVAFFGISFFLETVRVLTQRRLIEAEKKYRFLYEHDALTGLYNRYGYNRSMKRLMRREIGATVSLMILDVDRFKTVNDRYGHLDGDLVLQQFAAFLQNQCKNKADVCRWGGEEFAILYSGEQPALAFAQELRDIVEALPLSVSDGSIGITVSIGAASTVLASDTSPESLVAAADTCLFTAKRNGRNRVEHITV